MSIASELNNLSTNISNAYDAVETKGGTVPANKNMSNLAPAIASIPSGSSINTTTIEIGANSVTNAGQLYNYFRPYFQGAIALISIEMVESTYTVNNQFVRFRHGASKSYNSSPSRWRGGSVSTFPWSSSTYDTKIVAGTHYTITWIPAEN